jgi:hypothetical protein
MNKNDSGVVFPYIGKCSRRLGEIRNIEGYGYPTLLSCNPKQLSIFKRL